MWLHFSEHQILRQMTTTYGVDIYIVQLFSSLHLFEFRQKSSGIISIHEHLIYRPRETLTLLRHSVLLESRMIYKSYPTKLRSGGITSKLQYPPQRHLGQIVEPSVLACACQYFTCLERCLYHRIECASISPLRLLYFNLLLDARCECGEGTFSQFSIIRCSCVVLSALNSYVLVFVDTQLQRSLTIFLS